MDIKQELEKHQEWLKRNYFAVLTDTFSLTTGTMWGNTARAYKFEKCYLNYTPSSILKHWLHHHYFGKPEVLNQLRQETDFSAIHSSAVEGLKGFWLSVEPEVKGLQYYHFAKLIDLLFKNIPLWEDLAEGRRQWFFSNANVPLDKYSLLILREFNSKYDIPSPSMNFVKDKEHYDTIQKDIREMIAPFPPLLFDLYAWNYRRRQQIIAEEKFELTPPNPRNNQ